MTCKCGETGELKVFNSFQYYFCPKCRDEIHLQQAELNISPNSVISLPEDFNQWIVVQLNET